MKEKSGYKKAKRAVRIVVFLLLLSVLTIWATKLLESKGSYARFKSFYEEDRGCDVLFFGSSRVYSAVFPMEMWRDYGIVSYNLAAPSGLIPQAYHIMLNALEQTTPKLVVVDCGNLKVDRKWAGNIEHMHEVLDIMPLGSRKVEAVFDLLEDEDRKWEFLWDMIVYHDRWDELTKNDFDPGTGTEKGAFLRWEYSDPGVFPKIDDSQMITGDNEAIVYLEKIIEECRSRGIELLLTYLPLPADADNQMEAHRAAQIAESYGVDYLNFLELDVVDYETDCRDPAAHLNASGGEKVTAYLGKYIQDRYGIPDQRDNPDYADWHEDYRAYMNSLATTLRVRATDMAGYMMLLYNKHFSFCLYMEGGSAWTEDEMLHKMLVNAGVEQTPRQGETPTVVVMDNGDTGGGILYLKAGESVETSFGTVSFKTTSRGHAVTIDGREAAAFTNEVFAGAAVINNDTRAVVNTAQFQVSEQSVIKVR